MKYLLLLSIGMTLFGCGQLQNPGQEESAQEIAPNFTLPVCANGEGSWELYDYWGDRNGGDYHVIYLDIFATWCGPCQESAPTTEDFVRDYRNQELVVVGAGSDLNQPYSCTGWANTFDLSYPLLDDDSSDSGAREKFQGDYPVTIVIGHDMTILYKASGKHDENAIRTAIESAIERMERFQAK